MNIKNVYKIIAISSLLLCGSANAGLQGTLKGQVTAVQSHMTNWLSTEYNQTVQTHIYIDGLPKANSGINGCGTSGGFSRVTVSNENPAYKEFLATALTAKASGQSVEVHYLDSCSVRPNSWDLGIINLVD